MIPIIFSAQKCEKFLPQRVDTCLYLHGLVHDKQVSDILYRDLAWLSPLAWLTFASPYNNQIKINPYLGVWSWQMLSAPSSPYVIILPFFRFFLISICHHRPKRMHGVGDGRGTPSPFFKYILIHVENQHICPRLWISPYTPPFNASPHWNRWACASKTL